MNPLKKNFGCSYLENGWSDLFQIWYADLPNLQASLQQVWLGEESYFLTSCQYTHCVVHWLPGPHNPLPCVLIVHFSIMARSYYFSSVTQADKVENEFTLQLLINNWDTHLYAKYMPGTILLYVWVNQP